MSIYTVVTTDAAVTFYGISAAESALHVALQVDQEAYLRKATEDELREYWKTQERIVYSGSEPNGDNFALHYNDKGEACLFASIGGERYEEFWGATPGNDIATTQRQLYRWGYDMQTPNNLHKDENDAF